MSSFAMDSPCFGGIPLENGILPRGFCASAFPVEIDRARSVVPLLSSNSLTDMLVLERGNQSIAYLRDSSGNGFPDTKITLASAPDLNHGLAVHKGFVYASSDSTVYRWPLDIEELQSISTPLLLNETTSSLDAALGKRQVVVDNINRNGRGGAPLGHTTRTLIFDDQDRLYISVGSDRNIDPDSFRSRIRRVTVPSDGAEDLFPMDFLKAEVFADGLRNEVGLAFDSFGVLWGVENAADRLVRDDLGGDIHNDNPAEELNRFPEEYRGRHWGYPYCWSEFLLDEPFARGPGTAWVWPSFLEKNNDNGDIINVTDAECRDNYVRSELAMQAHSAPLGITFYQYKEPSERPATCPSVGAFPEFMNGYAFIAFHGSWNRDIPTGYKVVYVPMDENGRVTSKAQDLLAHGPPNARWGNGLRPVDVAFDDCGRLIVTSDGTRRSGVYVGSKVLRIAFQPQEQQQSPPLFCFSSMTTVEKLGGERVNIKNVKVGDMIRVAQDSFEPVHALAHWNDKNVVEFVQLHFTNDVHQNKDNIDALEMSANHLIAKQKKDSATFEFVRAGSLKVGDIVQSAATDKDETLVVSKVSTVQRRGLYAPLTYSGTLVVNDNAIVVSTYVALQQDSDTLRLFSRDQQANAMIDTRLSFHFLSHQFMAPFRMMHRHLGWNVLGATKTTKEKIIPFGIPPVASGMYSLTQRILLQPLAVQIFVWTPLIGTAIVLGWVEQFFLHLWSLLLPVALAFLLSRFIVGKKKANN